MMTDTDRAVSTPLAYVLNLAIATVLITGLIMAGTSFITDQREEVVRTELRVIGQQLAADIQHADRLVQAQTSGNPPELSIRQTYPQEAAGTTYTIVLRETSSPTRQFVNITATGGTEVSVSVRVPTHTDLGIGSTASGGTVEVVYRDADGDGDRELVIQSAD